jgi:hypothetical protein
MVFLLQCVSGVKSFKKMHEEIIPHNFLAPNHFPPPLLYSAGKKRSILRLTNDRYTLDEEKGRGQGLVWSFS